MRLFRGGESPAPKITIADRSRSALPGLERPTGPETASAVKTRELSKAAGNVLYGEMHRVDTTTSQLRETGGDAAVIANEKAHPGDKLVGQLKWLDDMPEGALEKPFDLKPDAADGPLKGTVTWKDGDTVYDVQAVKGRVGDNFICEVYHPTLGPKTMEISRSGLIQRRLLAEETIASEMFPADSADRKVVSGYLKSLKGEDAFTDPANPKAGEELQTSMHEVANRPGSLSLDKFGIFVDNNFPELPVPPGADMKTVEAITKRNARRSNILARVKRLRDEGRVYMDYEAFTDIAGEGFQKEFAENQHELQVNEIRISQTTDKKQRTALEAERQELQADGYVYDAVQEAMIPGGALEGLFEGMQSGQIPREQAQKFEEALLSGKADEAIESVFLDEIDQAKGIVRTEADRKEHVARLKKSGKVSLYSFAAILASGAFLSKFIEDSGE